MKRNEHLERVASLVLMLPSYHRSFAAARHMNNTVRRRRIPVAPNQRDSCCRTPRRRGRAEKRNGVGGLSSIPPTPSPLSPRGVFVSHVPLSHRSLGHGPASRK